jgi:hypothetical protein
MHLDGVGLFAHGSELVPVLIGFPSVQPVNLVQCHLRDEQFPAIEQANRAGEKKNRIPNIAETIICAANVQKHLVDT